MTLKHKIKLIWCRFTWWLKLTDKAIEYHDAKGNYQYLLDLYNEYNLKFLDEQKKKQFSNETIILKAKVDLLAMILDIKP